MPAGAPSRGDGAALGDYYTDGSGGPHGAAASLIMRVIGIAHVAQEQFLFGALSLLPGAVQTVVKAEFIAMSPTVQGVAAAESVEILSDSQANARAFGKGTIAPAAISTRI